MFKGKKALKVLLINPFGVGDVIFSTPLIKILKKSLPGSSVYYLCNKRAYGVIEKCPDLDGIFVFEKGDYRRLWRENRLLCLKEFIAFARRIKNENFDLAVDMSLGHQYGFFLFLLGVPHRIGFDYKGRGRFLTKKLEFDGFNDKPIGEYYKDLMGLIGINAALGEPTAIWWTGEDEDYIKDFLKKEGLNEKDVLIGVAPGGGVSFGQEKIGFKRWPAEKFAELAVRLIENLPSPRLIFLWGPGEEPLIEEIGNHMDARPVIAPKTNLRQLACLMSKCACVVCNDSGPLHVAVAAGAKTVSVFGPSDHNVYGPYPPSGHTCVVKDLGCRPCYKRFRLPDCESLGCLNGVEVDSVYSAVVEKLKSCREKIDAAAKG